MNTKQEIILRYYRQGHSQRRISRDLKINRKTVKKYLQDYENSRKEAENREAIEKGINKSLLEPPQYDTSKRKKRKLSQEMVEEIEKYLEKNREKRKSGKRKQVLKKIDIWKELKRQGHKIGYTTVCNYIRGQEGRQEAYIRQHYEPGDVCEFDWGEVKLKVGGINRGYQLAVFTLSWSNYRYAILYARQDSQSFQQSHVSFFTTYRAYFGYCWC